LLQEDDEMAQARDFMADFSKTHHVGPIPLDTEQGRVGEDRMLRGVRVVGKYYLFLWDTFQRHGNHNYVGYRFVAPDGSVLFQGTDYGIPQQEAIDSDEVLLGLLRWFTYKPNEQDADESDFTPQQLEFMDSDDASQIAVMTTSDVSQEKPFTDLPGYEHGDDGE
jgi:hypothetical protein